ncbi:MAG: phage tail protein [Nitriliruptoraceae bacterium]|nr:phage tail protein [Nitriliruptoraceae bacterium]
MGASAMHVHGGANTAAFVVEIDGVAAGSFSECHGLEVQVQVETFEEGGVNGFSHRLPGRMSWPNLVLRRGVTWDNALFDWFNASTGTTFAGEGKASRHSVGITIVNVKGERLRSWSLVDAIPVRWRGPSLAVSEDGQPEEELEISHHGFTAETFKKA